jgi:hypothetical protein
MPGFWGQENKTEMSNLGNALFGFLMLYLYAIIAAHAIFSLIPAVVAHSKGRSFIAWWCYGFFLFLVALVHSMVLRPYVDCPHCGQQMEDTQVMYHIYACHRYTAGSSTPEPVRYFIPSNGGLR